ncbi:DNA binding domain, excisionase family [Mycobacteroides abscessus subsp. abscessus]|nr:DNA binding domain, excisionase family [Mycobacteroides abscessus subsp. abscessus]
MPNQPPAVPIADRPALRHREAAHLISVSEDSIRRAIAAGALRAVRLHGGVRILRRDLDHYLTNAPTA